MRQKEQNFVVFLTGSAVPTVRPNDGKTNLDSCLKGYGFQLDLIWDFAQLIQVVDIMSIWASILSYTDLSERCWEIGRELTKCVELSFKPAKK